MMNNLTKTKQEIQRAYENKKYGKMIFKPFLDNKNNVQGGNKIRVLRIYENGATEEEYFSNLDDLAWADTGPKRFFYNCYINPSLTDGKGGKKANMVSRAVLTVDIDNKDIESLKPHLLKLEAAKNETEVRAATSELWKARAKAINEAFYKLGISYNTVIDSGNGVHVYILIEATEDIERVERLQKLIAEKVGGDTKAASYDQLLRKPNTINIKDPKNKKPVSFVTNYSQDKFKSETKYRYSLETIEEIVYSKPRLTYKDFKTKTNANSQRQYLCIKKALEEGSEASSRNSDLLKIVPYLREVEKLSLREVFKRLEKWDRLSNYSSEKEHGRELYEKQVAIIYKYQLPKLNCLNCPTKGLCYEAIEKDANKAKRAAYLTNEEIPHIIIDREMIESLGALEIYLYAELSLTGESNISSLSDRIEIRRQSVSRGIKKLLNRHYISERKQGNSKYYKINENKELSQYIKIHISILDKARRNEISEKELKTYITMKMLNKINSTEDLTNEFNFLIASQEEISRVLGITRKTLAARIDNLVKAEMVSIKSIENTRGEFDYYAYVLRY